MWDLIVSVPDHCLSFYFLYIILMILYMYVARGRGHTAPRGQKFDVNRNVVSLRLSAASSK